nr:hypothetical protein [Tanacetum cinerariifolium]
MIGLCFCKDTKAKKLREFTKILGVILIISVSRPQLKRSRSKDRVLPNNSHEKKQEVEDHHRNFMFSNNKTTVTLVEIILFIIDSGCSKHMTENLKLLSNFMTKFLGSRGTYLYSVTLQHTSTLNPICLMAKASSSQAWLWHHRLSHLNFDTVNLLLKYDIMTGLPKLKFVKDNLCSSCELRKAKQTDGEMCMFTLIVIQTKPKKIKEAMADFAWIEAMQEELHQFDRLDTNIIHQPDGFVDPHHPNKVYRLKKALYGLKQAPMAWYDKLSNFMVSKEFSKGSIDPTLRITKKREDILLVQFYHCMTSCDCVGTSMATKPIDVDLSGNPVDQMKYRSMVGALMYLTKSRPNIIPATCYCARYQARPIEKHLKEVKWIIRYLKNTINMRLWYTKDIDFLLTAFLDLNHAGCLDIRKSTSGGIQFLGGDKLASWSSKKQDYTSMSSAEAEFVSLSMYCAQVLWLSTHLIDYGFYFDKIPMTSEVRSYPKVNFKAMVNHEKIDNFDFVLPVTAIHAMKHKFENSLVGFFVGKKVAFLLVKNYVTNTWAKFGFEKVMSDDDEVFYFKFTSFKGLEQPKPTIESSDDGFTTIVNKRSIGQSPHGYRIIVGWNVDIVNAMVLTQSDHALHVKIIHKASNKTIYCSFIYVGGGGVLRKLDNIMGNIDFIDSFLGAYAIFQPYRISNHSLAVLKLPTLTSPKPKPFKFFNFLASKTKFIEVLESNWNTHIDGYNMFKVVSNMKILKKPLWKLLYEQGNLHERVNRLQIELDAVQKTLDTNPVDLALREEECVYVQSFNDAKLDEEIFKQKAKVEWLAAGDSNSTFFFHKSIKCRTQRSRIETVLNSNIEEVSGSVIMDVFVSHYEHFLGSSMNCNHLNVEGLFSKSIPTEMAANMVREISNNEIKASMFDIGDDRAPILKEINHTFLDLIPKSSRLNILGFLELPVKYLGILLISSRLLDRDCKIRVEKANNRIEDWKKESLKSTTLTNTTDVPTNKSGLGSKNAWEDSNILPMKNANSKVNSQKQTFANVVNGTDSMRATPKINFRTMVNPDKIANSNFLLPIVAVHAVKQNSMCVEAWGRIGYARALIEVCTYKELKKEVIMAIPNVNDEGASHPFEKIRVKYEWKPPLCVDCHVFGHTPEQCPERAIEKPSPIRETDDDGFTCVANRKSKDTYARTSSMTLAMCEFKDYETNIEVVDVNSLGLHYTWTQKPKGGGGVLKKLDRIMGNHYERVNKLRLKLDEVQKALDANPADPLFECVYVQAFNEAKLDEERFLKQKVKVDWLEAGDTNSTYFHKTIKCRNQCSRIESILNTDNVEVSGSLVPDVFVSHYEQFLAAMFDIGDDCAPGPDGYTSVFFKRDGIFSVMMFVMRRRVRLSDSFRYHRYCEEIQLINMCFADDLFIFARGDVESSRVIMDSREEFKLISGLIPSIPKSTAYFCNVLNHTKVAILSIMPFAEGELRVKYLGVPLISSWLLNRDFKILVKKAKNRIGDWKSKSLSFAGRLQLCKSVISSMHVFGHRGFSLTNTVADLVSNEAWSWPQSWLLKTPDLGLILVQLLFLRWLICANGVIEKETFHRFLLLKLGMPLDYAGIWCLVSHDIPLHAFHLWLVMRNGLKTHDKMRQWDVSGDIDLNLLRCALCDNCSDSHMHLFFECTFLAKVWNYVRDLAGMDLILPVLQDILLCLLPMRNKRTAKSVFEKLILAASAYFIWMEHNNKTFKNTRRSLEEICDLIMVTVWLKLISFLFKNTLTTLEGLVAQVRSFKFDCCWCCVVVGYREMDKGFLNRKTTSSKVVKNDLVVTRSVLGDLAGKIKSIDGKILGKDGNPMMPRRCISNLDVLKESVRADVCLADVVVEQASLTDDRSKLADQQVGLDREAMNRLDLGPSNTMVNDTSCYTNVAPIELNNSSKVILPMAAINEVNARFVNTLYGFPVGKKLAFPMVENYVKHTWAKVGLKRAMMHHGGS